jgi:biotin transport system substrate-specific component
MNTAETVTKSGVKGRTYAIAATAVMAAALCIIAPFSVPIGPVPISLATLVVYLAAYVLGWKMGAVSVLIYLLIGTVGLPVFSGFSGGFAKLAGPTGGYLIGYVPLALISGLFILLSEKLRRRPAAAAGQTAAAGKGRVFDFITRRLIELAGMLIGTAILYTLGTAWFCILSGSALSKAMTLCVLPFIPGDLIKIFIALVIGPELRKRIK